MTADRGRFIALEGLDGSGTTTQAQDLVAWLSAHGRRAQYTKEPSDGPFGTLLRHILIGDLRRTRADGNTEPFDEATLALAFAADRLDHLATELEPALREGTAVVCDRYVLSSLAYQGRALDLAWLQAINARCRVPDLTIYLDVPVDVCLMRIERARRFHERYEQESILEDVRTVYERAIGILRQAGQRVVSLDATQPIAKVHKAILAQVGDLLKRRG